MFAAVNGFLVAVWLLTGGSTDELRSVIDDPTKATAVGFWPIWSILSWGTGLAIHGAVWVLTMPRRARRRLRGGHRPHHLAPPFVPAPPPIPVPTTPPIVHDRERETTPRKRWVVVMFTDVCDSTSLNEVLGDEAWTAILGRYRDVVRTAITTRGGTEIATTGDGFLLCFDSPSDAVLAGVDIQRALNDARDADPDTPHIRIGLHAGDVVDDGSDVLGHVVNLASRVSAAAERDEILVTEPVADQLVGSLRIEDRGLRELKGVSQPRHLLAVRWEA